MTATTAFIPLGKLSRPYSLYKGGRTTGVCPVCSRYALLSVRHIIFEDGVPIACLLIWHWYIFRGDWLKSEKGVMLARIDKILVGLNSICVVRLGIISASTHAMFMYCCSKGPT